MRGRNLQVASPIFVEGSGVAALVASFDWGFQFPATPMPLQSELGWTGVFDESLGEDQRACAVFGLAMKFTEMKELKHKECTVNGTMSTEAKKTIIKDGFQQLLNYIYPTRQTETSPFYKKFTFDNFAQKKFYKTIRKDLYEHDGSLQGNASTPFLRFAFHEVETGVNGMKAALDFPAFDETVQTLDDLVGKLETAMNIHAFTKALDHTVKSLEQQDAKIPKSVTNLVKLLKEGGPLTVTITEETANIQQPSTAQTNWQIELLNGLRRLRDTILVGKKMTLVCGEAEEPEELGSKPIEERLTNDEPSFSEDM